MRAPRASRAINFLYGMVLLASACSCASVRASGHAAEALPQLTAEDLFEIALLQARRGDFFRAEQYLVAARSTGYDAAAATYWLVRVCVWGGRYHSALRHGQQHLQRNPSHWRLRLVVASIHEALGELDEARQQLEGVVDADPLRALPHYRIGMLERTLPQRRAAARIHLEKYLALEPSGQYADEVRNTLERWDLDAPAQAAWKELGP